MKRFKPVYKYTPRFGEDKIYITTSNDRAHHYLASLDYELIQLHYGLKMPIKFIAELRNTTSSSIYQKIYRMRKKAYIYRFEEMSPDEIDDLIEKNKINKDVTLIISFTYIIVLLDILQSYVSYYCWMN